MAKDKHSPPEQMDLAEQNEWKLGHGGKRAGAGRKAKYEKTTVMRVPEKYKDVIKGLIAYLDDSATLSHYFGDSESEPVYLRSLQDKKQNITSVTKPFKHVYGG
jgi:hypothetical protein